ncbi:MAG: VirD4-like conjugal transfer protein, CD1115 family [Bacilli bacterium]
MKFKVTAKDFTIFIIFCVVLFIFSSLAVINISSLLSTGKFYGLNFFAGLGPSYIVPTLILFFAVLVGIFMSVSSTIFEHEKGSGIGLKFGEKDEKGYSRWAKPDEIKKSDGVEKVLIKDQDIKAAGIPLINNGKEIWVDNSYYHTLVIGATGSGKTKCLVDPQVQTLARKGESMILTDPKGELYRDHSEMLRAKGYKIVVLNFRDPQMGNAWNPLTLPYQLYKAGNTDKATELLEDVALNIIYDPENKNDPFWEKSASDFFCALALGLFEDAKEEQINLNSINYMSSVGEDSFATSNFTKEYFTLKGEKHPAYIFASNTINAPTDTKGSILSVFRQKIRLFARGGELSEMLSYSDFNMREIGTQKTAIFMIIHDEKTTYHALATIFLKQAYETLIDVAQHCPKGKLPFRTNFILDEFANMPPLKDVTTMVTAARSRDIRFTFIIQNFAQLNDVYGKETAETIRSNCGNLIYLMTTELSALEEISKLCGEVKSKEKDKTASTPLITVSDLQKLKLYEVVILRSRENPFRTKLTPSFEIDWGTQGYGSGKLVSREKREIDQFDIKEFVKVKKRNKLFEALDNNPFGTAPKNEPDNPTGGAPIFEAIPKAENNTAPTSPTSFTEPTTYDFNALNPFNMASPVNEVKEPSETKNDNLNTLFGKLPQVEEPSHDDSNTITAIKPTQNTELTSKFDIDSLIKRIDAKIAEKEASMQKEGKTTNVPPIESIPTIEPPKQDEEYENLEEVSQSDDYDKLDATIVERFDDFMKSTDDKKETKPSEPVINIDNDSLVVGDVTDDEFYDDFFHDDNE